LRPWLIKNALGAVLNDLSKRDTETEAFFVLTRRGEA